MVNSVLTSTLDTTTTVRMMLGTGGYAGHRSYRINQGQRAKYTLVAVTDTSAVAGCGPIWVTPGITTTQTITRSDCTQGPGGGNFLHSRVHAAAQVGSDGRFLGALHLAGAGDGPERPGRTRELRCRQPWHDRGAQHHRWWPGHVPTVGGEYRRGASRDLYAEHSTGYGVRERCAACLSCAGRGGPEYVPVARPSSWPVACHPACDLRVGGVWPSGTPVLGGYCAVPQRAAI